jgi:chromosome segregation ATPase
MTVALVVAAVACAWAWQLQGELGQANGLLADYERRISDLEDRLSDTDEGLEQNAAVQAAKIKELDSEVRKLWDNVWKKSKERLAALEASSAKYDKAVKELQGSVSGMESQLSSASGDIGKLKSVSGDLSRLMDGLKANQAEVERVADTLNRIDLELAKLRKDVQGGQEWEASVDAFRRQVNASLAELRNSVRALQAAP